MEAVTRLEQVSKRYADRLVLDAVSLEVLPEAHLALLGPSGSGKSTLLRIIAGLEIPDTGAVSVHGQPVSADGQILIPPHQRGLSLVFQDLGLWPGLTVLENVQLGLAGTRLSRRERAERAREMLAACRIEGLAREKPARLSGGEQQRTALARALALRPRLLLLDEPFSGLDLELKRHFYDEIRRLAGAFAATCLLVSHDPMEATAFCSHAAVLEGGRIQERGPLTALLSNPASATLRAFVDQLPGGRNRSGGA